MGAVIQGKLEANPPAELIREIAEKTASGALRLSRERAKAAIYFEDGIVVFAASNLRPHRLLEFLKRTKFVTSDDLADVPANATDEELTKLLSIKDKMKPEIMSGIRASHVTDILRGTLLWTDGEWTFDARVRMAGDTRVAVDAKRLLLESARHLPAAYIRDRFRDMAETLSPASSNGSASSLLPSEAFVLSRVTEATTLQDLLALCGLSEAEALRTIYGLSIAGYLRRNAWPATNISRAQKDQTGVERAKSSEAAPAENIDQLFARLAAASDHYEVLGIGRRAAADEIKSAYHELARRYHPDRFHQADAQLRNRVDSAFARISRAYETLNDPASREGYDAQFSFASSASGGKLADANAAKDKGTAKASHNDRAEAAFQRGVAAAKQNQHEHALRFFAEAASIHPRRASYRAEYGRSLTRDPKTRRLAEMELKAAIALEPENAAYRVSLAELYLALGLRRRAQTETQKALSIDPKNEAARSLLVKLK
jgi:curved DNA-binding protein CbpA